MYEKIDNWVWNGRVHGYSIRSSDKEEIRLHTYGDSSDECYMDQEELKELIANLQTFIKD